MSIHHLNGLLAIGGVVTVSSLINIAASRWLAFMKKPSLASRMETIGMVLFIAGLFCLGSWVVLAGVFGADDLPASWHLPLRTLVSGFNSFP